MTAKIRRLKDTQVDTRWHSEAKRQSDFTKIESIDVEDVFAAVRRVSSDVSFVAFLSRSVQVVILRYEVLELNQKTPDTEMVNYWSGLQLKI